MKDTRASCIHFEYSFHPNARLFFVCTAVLVWGVTGSLRPTHSTQAAGHGRASGIDVAALGAEDGAVLVQGRSRAGHFVGVNVEPTLPDVARRVGLDPCVANGTHHVVQLLGGRLPP